MYCPNCGTKNNQGLHYCTQCGANLNPIQTSSVPAWLTIAFLVLIGIITLAGLGLPIIALAELSKHGFPPDMLKDIAAGGLAVTVAIDAMIIWLFLHLIKIPKPPKQKAVRQQRYVTSDQVQHQIPSAPESIPSATEHTTRSLEPVKTSEPHHRETL
jgi:hypothetical protein